LESRFARIGWAEGERRDFEMGLIQRFREQGEWALHSESTSQIDIYTEEFAVSKRVINREIYGMEGRGTMTPGVHANSHVARARERVVMG
jgi:hypothetical protein